MSESKPVPVGDSMPKGLSKAIYERAQQQTPKNQTPPPKTQSGGDTK